ncbi:hypothetical protein [Maribacter flavus]|uniref:Uncharacterized protein n=1 Tax=Maribacter flavus TaxID=1658664 RepID=A0A5B2TVH8_9FLAO|nr:hypothetical protein [Maribacter flavus]KAA2218249.1 hypothetical protein F0361_01115 [Maribacter flavus]
MDTIRTYDALNRMRELTMLSTPFSMEFVTCNYSQNKSDGLKKVDKALLRTGLSRDKSERAEVLIGYTEEPSGSPKWFYLPLLTKFNGFVVIP